MPERIRMVLIGVALGAVWGIVLALIAGFNGSADLRAASYAVFSCALIGGGVAALFGTFVVARRGERISPKSPYRRYKKKGD